MPNRCPASPEGRSSPWASEALRSAAGVHVYPSDMAQNFWGAIWAWSTCFVVTIAVSLVTKPRVREELKGLVYSLTPRIKDEHLAWYRRPAILGVIVMIAVIVLNIVFW